MNRGNISKLEKLRQQHDRLKSRIQKMESVQKASEHKKDTRRKILIGSYFIDQAMQQGTYEDIKTKMADFLTRNSDRVLFDLPELKEEIA